MDVSAERGPRAVWNIWLERWTSRYQPPSGCGSSARRETSSDAGVMESREFVGICRRNLRQIATLVTRAPGATLARPRVAASLLPMTRKRKIVIGLAVAALLLVAA